MARPAHDLLVRETGSGLLDDGRVDLLAVGIPLVLEPLSGRQQRRIDDSRAGRGADPPREARLL